MTSTSGRPGRECIASAAEDEQLGAMGNLWVFLVFLLCHLYVVFTGTQQRVSPGSGEPGHSHDGWSEGEDERVRQERGQSSSWVLVLRDVKLKDMFGLSERPADRRFCP